MTLLKILNAKKILAKKMHAGSPGAKTSKVTVSTRVERLSYSFCSTSTISKLYSVQNVRYKNSECK